MSSEEEIARLKRRVAELEHELNSIKTKNHPGRNKIQQMSSEVVDSNPYRLEDCSDVSGCRFVTLANHLCHSPSAKDYGTNLFIHILTPVTLL